MPRVRMAPEERRKQLLDHAVQLAEAKGYNKLTRVMVAEAAGVTDGLITRYFDNRAGLRAAVLDEACRQRNAVILEQARVVGGSDARKAKKAI